MTRAEMLEKVLRRIVDHPASPHHPSKLPPPNCLCRWCDARAVLALPGDGDTSTHTSTKCNGCGQEYPTTYAAECCPCYEPAPEACPETPASREARASIALDGETQNVDVCPGCAGYGWVLTLDGRDACEKCKGTGRRQ